MTQQPGNDQNPQENSPQGQSPQGQPPQGADYGQAPQQPYAGQQYGQQPGYQQGSAPSASSAHGAGYQGYPQGGYQQPPQPKKEPAGFGVLFDLDFSVLKVEKAAKAFYTLVLVIAAVWYLSSVISGLVVAIGNEYTDFHVWTFLNPLLFGWIVPVLTLIGARLLIELTVAAVRTAQKQ